MAVSVLQNNCWCWNIISANGHFTGKNKTKQNISVVNSEVSETQIPAIANTVNNFRPFSRSMM